MKMKTLTIIILAAAFQSCNSGDSFSYSTPTPNEAGSYNGVSTNQIVGVVSVSTEGVFGGRSSNGIERRLRKQAKERFGSSTIINIRYENDMAYADVIK